MERVVYIDSLFLINGIINYFLLLAASRMGGFPPNRQRLALAAMAGAVYAVAVILPPLGFLGWWPVKAIAGVGIVLLAFGRTKRWLRLSLLFYGASVIVGGVVLAMGYTIGGASLLPGGVPYMPVPFRVLVLAAAGCYLMLGVVFRQGTQGGARELTTVLLTAGERQVRLTALIDSGHSLEDPVSGAPVVVGELDALRPLLPPLAGAMIGIKGLAEPGSLLGELAAAGETRRFRLLPYRSLGVSNGLLLVYKPDTGHIGGKKIPGLLVGLSPIELSDNASYQALVGNWN
jgi:stage II sporulation protein GA (sporulation sigma-E factor processing peptidase)